MTQIEAARQGVITEPMKYVAAREELDPELIRAANRHGMAMIFTGERHYRH